jgi:hypothetical protein
MAKKQTFADKAAKSKSVVTCPVCNEPLAPTLVLRPVATSTGGQRMREARVTVCNCNRKEIYG